MATTNAQRVAAHEPLCSCSVFLWPPRCRLHDVRRYDRPTVSQQRYEQRRRRAGKVA